MTMNMLWIGNGRVVLPDEIAENGSVLIRDGRIERINAPCPDGVEAVDAGGGCILPGFIDIHLHGGGGADFMDAEPESAGIIARAHCEHGNFFLSLIVQIAYQLLFSTQA